MIQAFMVAGEPFEVFFNFKLDSNTPLSLAGYEAKCELRNQRENGNLLLSIPDASPYFVRDLEGGQIHLKIPAPITMGMDFQKAVLDLFITNGDNGVRSDTIEIIFQRGVTRP